jgi:hypothetical protein
MSQTVQLFPLGQIVATPGALAALEQAGQSPHEFLTKHVHGDWGEIDEDDKRENELSLRAGFRLLSAYQLCTGERLWIISEADRSATTLLLPAGAL